MRDRKELSAFWERHREETVILATLVRVEGSSYRRPGARKLILRGGESCGLLSGGCLEGEFIAAALDEASPPPCVKTFDTRDEADRYLGSGTGCQGKLWVFFEEVPPLPAADRDVLLGLTDAESAQMVTTVLDAGDATSPSAGTRLVTQDGFAGREQRILSPAAVRPEGSAGDFPAPPPGEGHEPSFEATPDGRRFFHEPLKKPLNLTIFGCGPDCDPVYELGLRMGWDVTLVDHRPAFARPERFPEARAVVVSSPESVESVMSPGPNSAAVVMTHNFRVDLELLARLLQTPVPYVGVLGARKRAARLRQDLENHHGAEVAQSFDRRVHAPIGLDLGGEGPSEIALSIVSQIHQTFAQKATPRAARVLA